MSGELQNTPGGACVRQGCFSCLSAFSLRITSVACHPPMAPPMLRLISDKCGNVCQIPDKHICAIRIYNTATGSPAHNIVLSGISTSLSASTCFYIAFYLPFLPFFTIFALSFYIRLSASVSYSGGTSARSFFIRLPLPRRPTPLRPVPGLFLSPAGGPRR